MQLVEEQKEGHGSDDDAAGAACLGASVVFHVAAAPPLAGRLAVLYFGRLFMRCRI